MKQELAPVSKRAEKTLLTCLDEMEPTLGCTELGLSSQMTPISRREYHRAAGPSRDSVNSAIFEASISAGVNRCVEWLACQVDTKARMCDSASGPSVYRGYGYGMMS